MRRSRRKRTNSKAAPTPRVLAHSVIEVSSFVIRLLRTELARRPDAEISVTHMPGMLYMRTAPGCSVSQMARYLGLGMPTASKLVSAWTRKGWVRPLVVTGDRRRRALYITAEGAACLQRTLVVLRDILATRLAGVPASQRAAIRRGMSLLVPRVAPIDD